MTSWDFSRKENIASGELLLICVVRWRCGGWFWRGCGPWRGCGGWFWCGDLLSFLRMISDNLYIVLRSAVFIFLLLLVDLVDWERVFALVYELERDDVFKL